MMRLEMFQRGIEEEPRDSIVASFQGQTPYHGATIGIESKKDCEKRRPSELHPQLLAKRPKLGKG